MWCCSQAYVAGDSTNAVLQGIHATASVPNVWSGFVRGAEAVLAAFESSSLVAEAEFRDADRVGGGNVDK
jgi:hypothetical protein